IAINPPTTSPLAMIQRKTSRLYVAQPQKVPQGRSGAAQTYATEPGTPRAPYAYKPTPTSYLHAYKPTSTPISPRPQAHAHAYKPTPISPRPRA
ncbi:hypothetical protein PTT_18231, partial [Pyrenophora teres f. teres 0-1]